MSDSPFSTKEKKRGAVHSRLVCPEVQALFVIVEKREVKLVVGVL